MEKYLINLETSGLHFSVNNMKPLVKAKVAKFLRSEKNKTLDQHKQKAINCLEYFDLDFVHLEHHKTSSKSYNLYYSSSSYNKSGIDSQIYLLIISKNNTHESYYLDTKDIFLRNNKYVLKALKNQPQYKVIELEKENLENVYIDYDYRTKREYLTASYKVGSQKPIYIQKLFN